MRERDCPTPSFVSKIQASKEVRDDMFGINEISVMRTHAIGAFDTLSSQHRKFDRIGVSARWVGFGLGLG
jgi:hypothetical protein